MTSCLCLLQSNTPRDDIIEKSYDGPSKINALTCVMKKNYDLLYFHVLGSNPALGNLI